MANRPKDDYVRLKEEQAKLLKKSRGRLEHWQKLYDEYDTLSTKLDHLADKVTHDVMVPFGPLAFMPGRLYHTNEILVLLGDNWFAERSAVQAKGIANRRMDFVNENIEACKVELKHLEEQESFTKRATSEKSQFVEIKEDYVEDSDEGYQYVAGERRRMAHKAKWASASEQKKGTERTEIKQDSEDARLWARLEQLEKQEMEEDSDTHSQMDPKSHSHTKGFPSTRSESTVSQKITFKHSKITSDISKTEDLNQKYTSPKSPADIYLKCYKPSVEEKSEEIQARVNNSDDSLSPTKLPEKKGVKWSKDIEEVRPISPRNSKPETKEQVIKEMDQTAFSGVVLERTTSSGPTVTPPTLQGPSSQQDPPKKVSKFKTNRNKQK